MVAAQRIQCAPNESVFLPFIEDDLQATEPDGQQA